MLLLGWIPRINMRVFRNVLNWACRWQARPGKVQLRPEKAPRGEAVRYGVPAGGLYAQDDLARRVAVPGPISIGARLANRSSGTISRSRRNRSEERRVGK